MRWLQRRRRDTSPAWLDVDGWGILVQGDVAFVQAPGAIAPYAVHIPTAAIALARPALGKA